MHGYSRWHPRLLIPEEVPPLCISLSCSTCASFREVLSVSDRLHFTSRIELQDMYLRSMITAVLHFRWQVVTEAWKSTRVRVSIENCSPLTAVIAAFGTEPTPSRHDLLGHTMFEERNGTCGVDFITRPSHARDGVW